MQRRVKLETTEKAILEAEEKLQAIKEELTAAAKGKEFTVSAGQLPTMGGFFSAFRRTGRRC